jgi:hypothetical protein
LAACMLQRARHRCELIVIVRSALGRSGARGRRARAGDLATQKPCVGPLSPEPWRAQRHTSPVLPWPQLGGNLPLRPRHTCVAFFATGLRSSGRKLASESSLRTSHQGRQQVAQRNRHALQGTYYLQVRRVRRSRDTQRVCGCGVWTRGGVEIW